MSSNQKLELTRIWKNKQYKLEPRVLVENPELSYGDPKSENMLIHGDNLLALKALEQEYTGKVKCIYIDPPYNTWNAFEYYDDGVEHSIRLSLIYERLKLLNNLLSDDGVMRVTLDDKEAHYFKVIADEVFWRKNFVATIPWKSRSSISNDLTISPNHNFHFLYAKNFDTLFKNRKSFRLKKEYTWYKNPDNDPRWDYKFTPVDWPWWAKKWNPFYEFLWVEWYRRYSQKTMQELYDDWRIVKRWKSLAKKSYLSDALNSGWKTPTTWWDDCETATHAKKEVIKLYWRENMFDTPKPEKLMEKIIYLSTDEWDLVLDSFLWSWTTTAVAHKMWRKWIWVELGDHAYTHCKLRMDKVIDWTDGLKLSEELWWEWWGWYKFYELWPSLLARDKYGNYVINPAVNGLLLIQALCKVENFTYRAFDGWFKHGYSTEKDFIHVTTRHITQDIIEDIQETHLKPWETLLIMCKTFGPDLDLPDHIQVKKIPLEVMDKCEYGDDINYSLPVLSDNEESND